MPEQRPRPAIRCTWCSNSTRAERTVTIPAELQAALERSSKASEIFAALSYSCRKEHVVWIDGARKQETRVSRAQKAIAMLLDGKRTPN